MKRLTVLTVVTMLAVSSSGCGRNWDSWFNRRNNDICQPQCDMSYPEQGGIIYEGPVTNSLPPNTTILPEPAGGQ